jgi:hypothetical protein
MTEAPTLHAWVDESMHVAGNSLDEGVYLLAATVADVNQLADIRDRLRGLIIGANQRLHWRDESSKRRRTIAATIAEYEIAHTVVIGTPLNERKQERARRICMELMLMELDRRGVHQVWIESRKASQDLRDMKMLDAVRSTRLIGDGLRFDFERPTAEPMLWIPDAVAGALGAALKSDDTLPRELLAATITELPVRLT